VEGLAAGPALAARTGIRGEDLSPDHAVWDSVVDALAHLFATLVLTGVPRRIVLGGGIMTGNAFLLPRLRARTAMILNGYVALPQVADMETYLVPAALGGRAGPLGAVVLGRQALDVTTLPAGG
jgi:fructokinase